MVVDVAEGTVDGALQHEAANASDLVAAGDRRLHCIGDRVDHSIHGRNGMGHILPWGNDDSGKVSGEVPANSLFPPLPFCVLCLSFFYSLAQ